MIAIPKKCNEKYFARKNMIEVYKKLRGDNVKVNIDN